MRRSCSSSDVVRRHGSGGALYQKARNTGQQERGISRQDAKNAKKKRESFDGSSWRTLASWRELFPVSDQRVTALVRSRLLVGPLRDATCARLVGRRRAGRIR